MSRKFYIHKRFTDFQYVLRMKYILDSLMQGKKLAALAREFNKSHEGMRTWLRKASRFAYLCYERNNFPDISHFPEKDQEYANWFYCKSPVRDYVLSFYLNHIIGKYKRSIFAQLAYILPEKDENI